jgi:tetratricopeptide (TPR) repeat protein
MENKETRYPQAHLINILRSTRDHHPNFVLMLGAGTSVTSNVILVKDLLKEWRLRHYEMYKEGTETHEDYLKKQHWFGTSEEYSILFEKLYDQPSQRREFIESCIKDASPSWGYIYLVNLIRNRIFNTVFTTNFDDLLNEACYLFSSEVRPIVCAHDSSISSVRITSLRPKIIKLHGDFLFDNIKNTIRELETLEQNTQDKFKQYASEFGFIVLGYSGNDRSVMDTFNTLLRFDQYFPHGIYWCVRKGSILSDKVDSLRRFPKFKIIEIEGFDEFSAEVHSKLNLTLQPEMADPYSALAIRLNSLMEKINIPESGVIHPIIEMDIKALGRKISKFTENNDISIDTGNKIEVLPIPYGLLSNIRARNGNFEEALIYRMKELEITPTPKAFVEAFSLMIKSDRFDCEAKLLNALKNSKELFSQNPSATFDIAIPYISAGRYDTAYEILDLGLEIHKRYNSEFEMEYYSLNRAQIKKHKRESYNEQEIRVLQIISESTNQLAKMGALILLDRYEEAEAILIENIELNNDISFMKSWPIMKFLIIHLKDERLKRIFKEE